MSKKWSMKDEQEAATEVEEKLDELLDLIDMFRQHLPDKEKEMALRALRSCGRVV